MRKNFVLWLTVPFLYLSTPVFAEDAQNDTYTFDKTHTHIIFFINHLGFSNVIGRFRDFDGQFVFDEQMPEKSSVTVSLKPQSVDTNVKELDDKLQGETFFNSAKFPAITFKSTKIIPTGKNTGDIIGDVTLLGVTKSVTLKTTYNKSGIHPFTNNYVSGFSADATIKRSDFGMSEYIPMVGDDVKIHIETEGVNMRKNTPLPVKK